MSVKITDNRSQVMARFEQAFQKTALAYEANLHLVIRLKRGWPTGFGTTVRRNGQVVVGSTRNIFDTGALDKSQKMTMINPFRFRYSWSVSYAPIVHEGAVLRNGTRIPPRRFTRVAAQEANLPKFFADKFNQGTP